MILKLLRFQTCLLYTSNWKVLSLSMGYQNDILNAIDDEDLENKKDENNNKSTYKSSLLSVVRIYSDREDIKEDSFLKEKTSAKYFEEIIDIEVSFLSENIKEFNSTLDKEYKKISDAKSKICLLYTSDPFIKSWWRVLFSFYTIK